MYEIYLENKKKVELQKCGKTIIAEKLFFHKSMGSGVEMEKHHSRSFGGEVTNRATVLDLLFTPTHKERERERRSNFYQERKSTQNDMHSAIDWMKKLLSDSVITGSLK